MGVSTLAFVGSRQAFLLPSAWTKKHGRVTGFQDVMPEKALAAGPPFWARVGGHLWSFETVAEANRWADGRSQRFDSWVISGPRCPTCRSLLTQTDGVPSWQCHQCQMLWPAEFFA